MTKEHQSESGTQEDHGGATMAAPQVPETYTYLPLPTDVSCIRCLRFLPQTPDGEICLSLSVHTLEESDNRYDAISYTWGGEDASHRIWIDGRSMLVRSNLHRFLQHYQTHDFDCPSLGLWIDAICIDQDDVPEKNAQVMQMAKIFGNARRVLIWLCESSIQAAMLEEYVERFGYSEDVGKLDAQKKPYLLTSKAKNFIHNPYWKRVWIVQEMVMAKKALLVSGTSLLLLDNVHGFLLQYRLDTGSRSSGEYNTSARADTIVNLMLLRLRVRKRDSLNSTTHILGLVGAMLCKDSRDRMYGSLALLEWGKDIAVDYNRAKEELFVQVVHLLTLEKESAATSLSMYCRVVDALEIGLDSCIKYEKVKPPTSEFDITSGLMLQWTIDINRYFIVGHVPHVSECQGDLHLKFSGVTHCLKAIRYIDRLTSPAGEWNPTKKYITYGNEFDQMADRKFPQILECTLVSVPKLRLVLMLDYDHGIEVVGVTDVSLWFSPNYHGTKLQPAPGALRSRIRQHLLARGKNFLNELLSGVQSARPIERSLPVALRDVLLLHDAVKCLQKEGERTAAVVSAYIRKYSTSWPKLEKVSKENTLIKVRGRFIQRSLGELDNVHKELCGNLNMAQTYKKFLKRVLRQPTEPLNRAAIWDRQKRQLAIQRNILYSEKALKELGLVSSNGVDVLAKALTTLQSTAS